jgi:hypothetical protein
MEIYNWNDCIQDRHKWKKNRWEGQNIEWLKWQSMKKDKNRPSQHVISLPTQIHRSVSRNTQIIPVHAFEQVYIESVRQVKGLKCQEEILRTTLESQLAANP